MSVLTLTTSLFSSYDDAAVQAQIAAREAARARSKAALSEVKAPTKQPGSSPSHGDLTHKGEDPAHAVSNLQLLRKALDAHTIDVQA